MENTKDKGSKNFDYATGLVPLVLVAVTGLLIAYRVGFHQRTHFAFVYLDTVQGALIGAATDIFAILLASLSLVLAAYCFHFIRKMGMSFAVLRKWFFWVGIISIVAIPFLLGPPVANLTRTIDLIMYVISCLVLMFIGVALGLKEKPNEAAQAALVGVIFLYGCLIAYLAGRAGADWRLQIASTAKVTLKKGGAVDGKLFYFSEGIVIVCETVNCTAIPRDAIETLSIKQN